MLLQMLQRRGTLRRDYRQMMTILIIIIIIIIADESDLDKAHGPTICGV